MLLATLLASIALFTESGTCSRIQLLRSASDIEFRAAEELRDYLVKITGRDIGCTITPGPWYRDKKDMQNEILLVTLENGRNLLPKKAAEDLEKAKPKDSFVICSREDRGAGKAVCIAGKTPIGVYYGVYALLEDYLGCGFYHAGPDGEVVSKMKAVELPDDLYDFRTPWITSRRMSTMQRTISMKLNQEMFPWQAKRTYQWCNPEGLHGRSHFSAKEFVDAKLGSRRFRSGGEPFTNEVVPDSMFAEHPEYFALIKGKRTPGKYPMRRCFSNPDVQRLWIERGIAYLDYGIDLSLLFTDTPGGWCECEACKKYGSDEKGFYSTWNLYHKFVSHVASEIYKRRPDATIAMDAYLTWRELPTCKIENDPRFICVFSPHQRCYVHALSDPAADCNRHFHELYEGWHKLYPRMGLFEFYTYSFTEYAPIEYVLAKDMKYYYENGLEHFVEDTSNGSIVECYPVNNWQFYYILSKFFWNPHLDVEKEMDVAYRRYYGKAAEPMIKYHALRRQLWESAPGHAFMGCSPRHGQCLRVPGSQERLEAYLREAAALAKGDKNLESRVERDRKCLEGIWVARWNSLKKALAEQKDVSVGRVAPGSIAVDGDLSDDAWKGVPFVSGVVTKKKELPKTVTTYRAAFDGANWYFAVEAFAKNPYAVEKLRDGAVWNDDDVEIAIASPHGEYYHFIINANGVMYDACGMGTGFDYKGEMKLKRLDDRYVIELRVPLKSLGAESIGPGDEWKLFFGRAAIDASNPKEIEYTALDNYSAREPAHYRRAVFGKNIVWNGDFSLMEKGREKTFPKWFFSDRGRVVTNGAGRVGIRLEKSAILGTTHPFDTLPSQDGPQKLSGAIVASGPGQVTLVGTWWKSMGEGKPRKEGTVRIGTLDVPAATKPVPFTFELPEGAHGGLHVYGTDVTVESIEITK